MPLIPDGARQAWQDGDERLALTLLSRARDAEPAGSEGWAILERLCGLVLISMQREVEGTFALERADTLLERLQRPRPGLELLDD
ncbi:hypothetical protein [Deinococcus sonorensis]|uniref:Uncharacterized protein n=2 Tax=Deinococcus sonorensis TaxID=309891 RepID=A0AAU7UC82_9DEIO